MDINTIFPIPNWLSVLIFAMLPISELRGAIPIAISFGIDPITTYFLAVIGNIIPVIPLLLFLDPVSNYLRRYNIWNRFFTWLFTRTHRNHSERFEKYGTIALTIFVAIPLPVTGAWTGCAAAFVFGIKFKHALPAIILGVMIAGVIVTVITVTGFVLIA
ncbi:MAG: COG2426 family protein [Methanosarcinales archaeon]